MSNAAMEMQSALREQMDMHAREQEAHDQKLLRQKTIGMEMRYARHATSLARKAKARACCQAAHEAPVSARAAEHVVRSSQRSQDR